MRPTISFIKSGARVIVRTGDDSTRGEVVSFHGDGAGAPYAIVLKPDASPNTMVAYPWHAITKVLEVRDE